MNVSEVSLDIVVVDNKGRPITDLTADDFEVYQDKRQQEVTSSIYISNQAAPSAWPSSHGKASQNLPPLPAKTLKEEEVRRTIVFLLDNGSMPFQYMQYAKMSVSGFLEKQMLPGDLVAVMYTTSGNSFSDMFSSDKRLLSARLEKVPAEGEFYQSENNALDTLHRVYENQLHAISYGIRALKDMPGRKILFFLTDRPTVDNPEPVIFSRTPANYAGLYGTHYDRLADEAMRAGVVVHVMDTKGLEYYEPRGPDQPEDENFKRAQKEKDGALNPLPAKTGGVIIKDSNFFLNGIGGDVNNLIAGYYLVSYVPPPSTFDLDRYGRGVYHRVKVRVKRKGAEVHTRDGFYGRIESGPGLAPPEHPLKIAIFSPFLNADISVNIIAGYTKDDKADYLLRTWVHVDPDAVTIVDTEDGGAVIKLNVAYLTTGVDGTIYGARYLNYTSKIEPENKSETIEWIQKQGIRFSMLLPVKKPGAYSVRIAVQDTESGKVGSAYQFVEIPDLKKKKMALSDIFMIASDEDLAWMHSDVTKELIENGGVFSSVTRKDAPRSPALRTFMPGDNLRALTMVYNADPKAVDRSEIKTQSILYKDGEELMRSDPKPIAENSAVDGLDGIPILQKLMLGTEMTPGDYVLQFRVIDKKDSVSKENKPEGLFSKIMRAYINEQTNFGKMITEGRKSQALSFKVIEDRVP